MASEMEDLSSREAQTVCEALGRYEDTLRGAVQEIQVDMQVFKQGVGRQVEEVLRLASPLAHTVSELQQENRRLRAQLERLSRQVEALGRSAGLPQEWADEAAGSPPAAGPGSPGQGSAGGGFSSRAKLAVAGRSQMHGIFTAVVTIFACFIAVSSYGSPRSNFFVVKEEFQQPYNYGKCYHPTLPGDF